MAYHKDIMKLLRGRTYRFLRSTEPYLKTDMVYLASGGFWVGVAQVVATVTGTGVLLVLANTLSPETFGIYKYVLSLAGIIVVFSLSGIGTAVTQAVARGFEGELYRGFRESLKWQAIAASVSLGVAAYYFINGNNILGSCFVIIAFFAPVHESALIYNAYLQGKRLFKTKALYNAWYTLLPAGVLVSTVLLTHNPVLIILAYFSSYAATALALYIWTTYRARPLRTLKDKHATRYAKHLSAMNILTAVANRIDSVLVFHYIGAAELAVYSIAMLIPQQLGSIFGNLDTLALPKLAQHAPQKLRSGVIQKSWYLIGALGVTIVAYLLLAPYLFQILLPQYLAAIPLTQVAIFALIASASLIAGTALRAGKAVKELHTLTIVSAIAQIVILFVFIYFYGLWGAIIGRVVSKALKMVGTYVCFFSFTQYPRDTQPDDANPSSAPR